MAISDYILCCKCEVKLIYDGDRGNREWWAERFGAEPEIMCPDCKPKREWIGLTDEQIYSMIADITDVRNPYLQFARAIEARLKEENT